MSPRCAAEFLPHSVGRHWSVRISICRDRVSRDAGSTFDTQLSRHNIIGNQLRIRAAGWPINSKMTVCTSMDIAEIQRGILELPSGRRRRALEAWLQAAMGRKHCLQAESCRSTISRPSLGPLDGRGQSRWSTAQRLGHYHCRGVRDARPHSGCR